jgi:hypothetical protein
VDGGFAFFVAEEIAFLNNKIPAPQNLLTIVALHRLVKHEAVFGEFAFCSSARLCEPPRSIPKPKRLVVA